MKTKKLETTEKYSSIARRAKLTVEVEQKKRLGAWGKRVLVLDGATLYAYKTKGDGGSVGGWAIGGADVHVRRGNDSNREDGRHILVIARPPVYKLVFAFTTTYEQARMIQALSSSGATVTGLDAIMLLKNLRQQQEQEQEQKEQEERDKEQSLQKLQELNGDDDGSVTSQQSLLQEEDEEEEYKEDEEGEEEEEDDEEEEEEEEREDEEEGEEADEEEYEEEVEPTKEEKENIVEIQEIDESIYDKSTGSVVNPLYSSSVDLASETFIDRVDGIESLSSSFSSVSTTTTDLRSTSTFEASEDEAIPHLQVLSATQEPGETVNPLPKPPRASVSEGSPTNYSSAPESAHGGKNLKVVEDSDGGQSVLSSGSVQEDQSGDSEEGEGFYQVNPDPEESLSANNKEDNPHLKGQHPQSTTDKDSGEEEGTDEETFENNYVELLSKMKLERGLSIESQSGGLYLDVGSPEGMRKILGDSPLSEVSVKSPSPVNELGSEKEEIHGKDNNIDVNDDKLEKVEVRPVVPDEVLSDNDEKFEQLYRELSGKSTPDILSDAEVKEPSEHSVSKNIDKQNQGDENNEIPSDEGEEKPTVNNEDNNNKISIIEVEDTVDYAINSSPKNTTPIKRVNSIIKKKDSPSTGKSKKVQFNLNPTYPTEPDSSPQSSLLFQKDEKGERSGPGNVKKGKGGTWSKVSSTRKAEKESASSAPSSPTKKRSEGSVSPSASTPSPTKKKGIFSSMFSSSSSKKSVDMVSLKENTRDKKELHSARVGTNIKKESAPATVDTDTKKESAPATVDTNTKKESASATVDTNVKKESAPAMVDTNTKKDSVPDKADTNTKKDLSPTKIDTSIKKDSAPEKVNTITKTDLPPAIVDTSIKKDLPTANVETSIKKDLPATKVDTTVKRPPVTSQASLKRQPTVDLTAPLIIGGSVEMGGSINGKVSPRRIEVRDGHVLAFMPKAASPTSRLSLVGLSVTPMVGSIHNNALSLTRATRCMMVIKLSSRQEMMRWINVMSDEVIKATPENQRSGLVLYPSPVKEEPKKETEDVDDSDDYQQMDPKDPKEKTVIEKLWEAQQRKSGLPNGHGKERADVISVRKEKEVKKAPHSLSNGEVIANGDNEGDEEEYDTTDGWRKMKVPIVEEFEMEELPKVSATIKSYDSKVPATSRTKDSRVPATNKTGDSRISISTKSDELKVVEEHFKEEKIREEYTVKEIKKLNIEERWKEHVETKKGPHKRDSPVHRRHIDNKDYHPPLRRLSAHMKSSSQSKLHEQDTIENLLFVNSPPKRDYHANCHPPLERLSIRSRVMSASESNLRKNADQKPSSNIRRLHKFGSELTLQEKPKKEFNNNTISGTKDKSNLLVSSRIIRNQLNANKTASHHGSMSKISPTSSPSRNLPKKSLSYETKEVEIIAAEEPTRQELLKNGVNETKETLKNYVIDTKEEEESQWFEEDENSEAPPESSNDNSTDVPGITWSVAATREKFELLCSVSGENKIGKLTTKTPISRKRSGRGTVKKRRSIEGAAGRRPNARRNIRRPIHATNSNNVSSILNSSVTDTPSKLLQGNFGPQQLTNGNSLPSPLKANDADQSLIIRQDPFKLQPVRDRRKTFETKTADTPDSDRYKSVSTDSLNDIIIINHNNDSVPAIKEPTSPLKSPLRRTKNVLQDASSSSSSPEPDVVTSRLINGRPKGNIPEEDKGIVSRSLIAETKTNAERDADVVICWKGPYIAQETEQAVLSNISNAFLAKRRLLAREVAVARIQEKISALEETIWDLQASMAELDNQHSTSNKKTTTNWKTLEKSLRTSEEEMNYWTSRLTQTQKEADQARGKLAAALVTGLSQYSSSGDQQRQQISMNSSSSYLEGEDEVDRNDEEEDSFA